MNDFDPIDTSSSPSVIEPPLRRRCSRIRPYQLVLIILLALAVGMCSAYVVIRYNLARNDQYLNKLLALPVEQRRINILVMGVDTKAADNGRSDTLMLVSLDPATGKSAIMSIPRDARVQIPGRNGHDKINVAFPLGGPELVQKTVTDLLDIEIDHYVVVDFNGFAQIVDTLGGVVIDVPKRMYYVDRAQQLVIDLQPGKQHLNGEEALGYVRFRHDRLGDVTLVDPVNEIYDGRVERQLQFVKEMTKKLMNPVNVLRIPTLANQFHEAIQTDISTARMVTLANAARRLQKEQMRTFVLPGTPEDIEDINYWVVDQEKAQHTAHKMLDDDVSR